MDRIALPGVDIIHDLQAFPWPFRTNEFDEVYATHVLEHLPNLIGTLQEVHRIFELRSQLEETRRYNRRGRGLSSGEVVPQEEGF